MAEREGIKTLQPEQRRKAFARVRVGIEDQLHSDDDDYVPMNRSRRRALERELVKSLRHRGALE